MKPRDPLPLFDAPPAVIRQAGAWLARRDRGFRAGEPAEFAAWLSADPAHRAAFAQLERTSASFDRLQDLRPEIPGRPNPDAFAPRRRARRWFAPVLATAVLAAAASVAFLLWPRPRPTPTEQHRFATESSAYRRATLSDGTVLELNRDTVIEVAFTPTERHARLSQGEAHFQIARNAERPFVVIAKSVALRVVGTGFNVRMGPQGIEIVVTEGCVEVSRSGRAADAGVSSPALRLTAGQKIVVPAAAEQPLPPVVSVAAPEIARALAWQPRVAEFDRTPLADAIAELNRHAGGRLPPIVIADEELAALRIGGNFRVDQPEAFVALLERSFGISVARSADQVVLRKSR